MTNIASLSRPVDPVRAFIADEEGAVMTEMVIVLPVLMYLFLSNLLIADVNRFSLSRFGLTTVGTWRAVAIGEPGNGMARSDEIGSGLLPFRSNPSMWPKFPKALGIAMPTMHPFEILAMDSATYYQDDFTPARLGLSGGAMTYSNQYYINPVNAAIGSRVGNAPGSQDAQLADTQIGAVTQYSRLPILFDTYSPLWSKPSLAEDGHENAQRLRNVDRFTLLGGSFDFIAISTGTMLAGNYFVDKELDQLIADADLSDLERVGVVSAKTRAAVARPLARARGYFSALSEGSTHVTGMWKVDKSVYDHDHDVNGNMRFDARLTEKHRLQQVAGPQAWEMVQ